MPRSSPPRPPSTAQILRAIALVLGIIAGLPLVWSQVAALLMPDAPPPAPSWLTVAATLVAGVLLALGRAEITLTQFGIWLDLDGDGREGGGRPRLPVWLLAAFGAGLLSVRCSGAAQLVDVGAPVAVGVVAGEVGVPVCVKLGRSATCFAVRVYSDAVVSTEEPAGAQLCAEVRMWGVVLAERCASTPNSGFGLSVEGN